MLKPLKDGTWQVSSEKQMREALALSREKAEMVEEIEKIVEDEYGLSTLRKDSLALHKAVSDYLLASGKNYEDEASTFTLVKPKRWSWNVDKLRKILPKSVFLSVCRYEPDSEKIDDAVKAGRIKKEDIDSAYEAEPSKPYIRHTVKSNKAAGSDEAAKVKAALGGT